MKIGIIGCGFIGAMLAKECATIDEIESILLFDKIASRARETSSTIEKCDAASHSTELISSSDLVIESASRAAVRKYGPLVLGAGKDFMLLSVGAFQDLSLYDNIVELTKKNRANLYIPSGAVGGIDALKSASVAKMDSVELTTTKSPASLEGAPFFDEKGVNMDGIRDRTTVFEGSAREAIKHFPRNVNVSAALSLAGVGFDRTRVKVVLDPTVTVNSHKLKVSGRFGNFSMELNNFPALSNPKTSYLAALSAIAMIRNIVTGVWLGT